MVSNAIEAMYQEYCQKTGKQAIASGEHLWAEVLCKPEVAQLSFNLPAEVAEIAEMNTEERTRHLYLAEGELYKELKSKLSAQGTKPKNEELNTLFNKEREKMWLPHTKLIRAAEKRLFCAYLKQNNLERSNFPKFSDSTKRWSRLFDYDALNNEQREIIDFYEFCEGWNMTINKGDIMVRSQKDNSVPWDFMEIIESALGARRYHLG